MSRAKRVYGIDLGTTYSCIAHVDEHGKPVVVPNSESDRTTPSVVYFESKENVAVGKSAKAETPLSPELVVSAVKRHMGDPEWKKVMHGEEVDPIVVSAHILKRLVQDARTITGDEITDVVITCPAYFGVAQKEATKQAGTIAGLNVRYVIPEPTAAAVAFGMLEASGDQTILVYDLGGGTFDITVLDIKEKDISVVCTGGDHNLGGKNWDETLGERFFEQLAEAAGVSKQEVKDNPETREKVLLEAEIAKAGLSSKEKVKAVLYHDATRAMVEITRETFIGLTEGLLENTLMLTEELLEVAREKGHSKIDKMLLVGGSTHMPQVRLALEQRSSGFDIQFFDPDEVVAKGAALMGLKFALGESIEELIERGFRRDEAVRRVSDETGVSLAVIRRVTETTIRNVTSKSFGVVVSKGGTPMCDNLILVDDQVPMKMEKTYPTGEPGTGVLLQCVENLERERGQVDFDPETDVVGEAQLDFARELPRNSQVKVSFHLSEDGLLTMHGEDLTTKQEAETKLKSDAIKTAEELREQTRRNASISVSS